MDNKMSWLECMDCGYQMDLFEARQFRCLECFDPSQPKLRGLFDVIHKIPSIPVSVWEELFDGRMRTRTSGVWQFKEWIMPSVDAEDIVSLGEGIVPIVPIGNNLRRWLDVSHQDIRVIHEGKFPTGSFKDAGMTVHTTVAKKAGIDDEIGASTGDTSASASAYAAKAGIRCSVVLPKGKITFEQILQAKLAGALVILVPGSFDDCMVIVEELAMNHNKYPVNSLVPTRIEGHQATVFLTAQAFGWELPDWYVAPVGNGSDVSSIGKALRLMKQMGFNADSRILGAQLAIANPLYASWEQAGGIGISAEKWQKAYKPVKVTGETIATAMRIGDPVSWKKVIREVVASYGIMEEATEPEIMEGWMAGLKDGLPICPQTAVAFACLRRAIAKGIICPDDRIVVVSTADALKFMSPLANKKELWEGAIEAPDCRTESVLKILNTLR